jgi:eukaryotic-like serine/threonine-protein kinase
MGNIIGTIGRYQLDTRLGEGASGVVYRAYDPVMDRVVAIKSARTDTLTPEQISEVIAEYHHEAKIAGKYAHENIVTIYDVITHEGLDHIVMEYVPGRSVHDYMCATGPLDLDEALSITYKCCVALAYIHHHGVIHRDIKPGNIMYHPAQGLVKLMDFSVAHNIEDPPLRDTGTIAYMAPEHFDPKRRISLLTDIFALGATLYRILTGKYPFTSKNTAYQILHEAPVPITDLRPGIPPEVVAIIDKAMAKSDADRYQSASEFAAALRQVILKLYPDSNLLTSSVNYLTL